MPEFARDRALFVLDDGQRQPTRRWQHLYGTATELPREPRCGDRNGMARGMIGAFRVSACGSSSSGQGQHRPATHAKNAPRACRSPSGSRALRKRGLCKRNGRTKTGLKTTGAKPDEVRQKRGRECQHGHGAGSPRAALDARFWAEHRAARIELRFPALGRRLEAMISRPLS